MSLIQRTPKGGLRTYLNEEDGKIYYSVTSILSQTADKSFLKGWKERVGENEAKRVMNEATLRGTRLHLWAEEYLNGTNRVSEPWKTHPRNDEAEELAKPFWGGFRPVLDEIHNVHFQEVQVHHPDYRYAGTFDCYAGGFQRNKVNTIIDFKTSSKPKRFDWIEDYCIQCSAYAGAIKKCLDMGTEQAAVIIALANKDAQVYTLNKTEMLHFWQLWVERLNMFHSKYGEAV